MIKTKKDLREYIEADKKAMGYTGGRLKMIKAYLKGSDEVTVMDFIISLRKHEYVYNNFRKFGIAGKLWYFVNKQFFVRKGRKMDLYIRPNVFGKGLKIVHRGFIRAGGTSRIGENCTVLPRVLLGKRRPGVKQPSIFIGDNCYIGTGATILGPVKIGNNVTIGANAVVLDDVPDNCVVAGVPAKVVKVKSCRIKQNSSPYS